MSTLNKILKVLQQANKSIEEEIKYREKGICVPTEPTRAARVVKLKEAQIDVLSAITLIQEI